MPFRAVLIVPADDRAAVERALAGPADVVVLDVARGARREALANAAAALDAARPRAPLVWIAVSALDTDALDEDLAHLAPLVPDAVLLANATSAADVQHLGARFAVAEADAALEDGSLRIVAGIASAPALFELNAIARASKRLSAIVWDGEAFARDLDADEAREDGRWTDPLQTVRTLTLAACADAKLPAIDSVLSGADDEAFRREAETARRDGFAGKAALTAAQAEIAQAVFAGKPR